MSRNKKVCLKRFQVQFNDKNLIKNKIKIRPPASKIRRQVDEKLIFNFMWPYSGFGNA